MADMSPYDLDDKGSIDNAGSSSKTAKKKSGVRDAIASAGQSMNERSVDQLQDIARQAASRTESFKRGGTKRGDGKARLHKGEDIMAPKRGKKKRMGRRGGGR